MKFRVERKNPPKETPAGDDFELAKQFASAIHKELDDFLKAAVLFGSVARGDESIYGKDIDVLLVIDDLTRILSDEVVSAYRVITERTAARISKRLHITTMKLTNFWEYLRAGDPIAVNMLRDGYPLYDSGFFEPAQQLLYDGRIKPTRESVYAYYARAPLTLANANWHVMQGAMDLYWAVIDAAHAALMKHGHIAPTPRHVSGLLHDTFTRTGMLDKKHIKTMDEFFALNKNIVHRKISDLTGKDYDSYRKKATEFIHEMERLIKD